MNAPEIIKKYMSLMLLSLLLVWMTGCTVTREATLRDAEVKGAINLPPLHPAEKAESGKFIFSPHLNYTPSDLVRANVHPTGYVNKSITGGSEGSHELKLSKAMDGIQTSAADEGNLSWEIPEVSAGFDAEVFIWSSFALTGSFNFASGSTTGSVGLALQSVPNEFGIRLDAGWLFNHFSYNVYSTVEEKVESIFGSSSETYYFHDIGSANSTNFYISLTLNSVSRENLFGGLLSLGYFRQTILDYNPGHLDEGYYILIPLPVVVENNTRLEASMGYFNIFPAVFLNLNENMRLIAGTRMLVDIEMGNNDVNFWPAVQMEFAF